MSRPLATLWLTVALLGAVAGFAGGASAANSVGAAPIALPVPPPPTIPTLPKGKQTSCKMTGPAWVLYGVHAPDGPPRRGKRYLVHAWGISCHRAMDLLRAFFAKIPPHPMGRLKGGPKGFTCKGRDDPGTVTKNQGHDGSCLRLKPAATFDWGPTGGKVS